MKERYLVFAGYYYYPSGGWDDFVDFAESIDIGIQKARNVDYNDWWHIVDSETMEVVRRSSDD